MLRALGPGANGILGRVELGRALLDRALARLELCAAPVELGCLALGLCERRVDRRPALVQRPFCGLGGVGAGRDRRLASHELALALGEVGARALDCVRSLLVRELARGECRLALLDRRDLLLALGQLRLARGEARLALGQT